MSQVKRDKQPFGVLVRMLAGGFALVAVPPFVLLAVAPMLLFLAPVVLLAIPFMVVAFAGAASEAKPRASCRPADSRPAISRAATGQVTP